MKDLVLLLIPLVIYLEYLFDRKDAEWWVEQLDEIMKHKKNNNDRL